MAISSIRSNTPSGLPFGQTITPLTPMGTSDRVNMTNYTRKVKHFLNIRI